MPFLCVKTGRKKMHDHCTGFILAYFPYFEKIKGGL
jgi:hypothetical protein